MHYSGYKDLSRGFAVTTPRVRVRERRLFSWWNRVVFSVLVDRACRCEIIEEGSSRKGTRPNAGGALARRRRVSLRFSPGVTPVRDLLARNAGGEKCSVLVSVFV